MSDLDCGHGPTPQSGIGTGYAINPDGRRLCYDCAAEWEAKQLTSANDAVAYLEEDSPEGGGAAVTTWSGRILARVTSLQRTRGGGFGGERIYFRAVTPNGVRWYGNAQGFGMVARLHRIARDRIQYAES